MTTDPTPSAPRPWLSGRRRDLLVALLFALGAAALRLPRLGVPDTEIFDEVYHAKTALEYLRGQRPTEWVHPPTAKLLIAVPVWLFGYDAWSWRLAPALAGILLAPVFYLLARRVLPTERAAVLATVLLSCDGVYLVQSRTAMTNIFAVLFQVSAALALLRAALPERLRFGAMTLAGVCLGLALSTRWTSLWATAFLGVVLLGVRGWRILRPREVALTAWAFGALPLLIYAVSYLPLLDQRHDFRAEGAVPVLKDLVQEQKNVWGYHANLVATHPYFSRWYTWPWLVRPTWYYFNQDACWVRGIVAIGNPALWWASLPASLAVLLWGLRTRSPWRVFAGLGYFALYLPWGLSPRTLNYSHYLFEAIPYACLSLGFLLDAAWPERAARPYAVGYVALVVLMLAFFLPFLMGLPVPISWYYHQFPNGARPWTWFSTWV